MRNTTFEPRSGDMHAMVRGGVAVTGLAQFVKLITQMLSVLVLSRLLRPEDFGLIGMATPFYGLITLFQDLGLSQAVIQKKDLSHDDINSLFWINVCVGVVLSVLLVAAAPLVGLFYRNAEVSVIMTWMVVLPLIAAIGTLPGSILARRMEFGALALIDAGGSAGGFIAALLIAVIFHNFWALYASMFVTTVVASVACFVVARWWPSAPKITSGARAMLHFGAGVTGFNLTSFIARNLDNALIGRSWGDVQLGFYDRAYKLLLLPLQQVTNPVAKVMVPALSRLNEDTARYEGAFFKSFGFMLCLTSPGIVFMVANAGKLIPFVMGVKWAPCVPIFQVLGLIGLIQVINNPSGWLLISQGRTKLYAIWGAVTAVTSAAAFFIGLSHGPVGVAIAYGISEAARTPIMWWLITRKGHITLGAMLKNTLPMFLSVLVALTIEIYINQMINGLGIIGLGLNALISYGVFFASLSLFPRGRGVIREGVNQVQLSIGSKRRA